VLSKTETSRQRKEGIEMKMNGDEVDKWSEKHVGSLALTRTILGFLNLLLAVVVIFKLFGVI
jgi:hypothetical protein